MPEPQQYYKKQGPDGKWYQTQAASPEEAKAKLSKVMTPAASKQQSDQTPKAYGFTPSNMYKNLTAGGRAAIEGTYVMGKSLLSDKPDPSKQGGNVEQTLNKFVFDPMREQQKKAKEDFNANRLLQASAHFVAGLIPFLGPVAADIGEQAGKGDIGGAGSKGLGMYLVGKGTDVAMTKTGDFFDASKHIEKAKNLNTAALKTGDAGVKDYNRSVGLEVAQKQIMGSLKELPNKIEQVRAQQDAKVQALTKYHDAKGTVIDAQAEMQPLLQNVAARLNSRGLFTDKVRNATKNLLDQITTERDMTTGKAVKIDLRKLSVSKAIALSKGLGQMANWDSETKSAMEPFVEKARQAINNALDKVDPEIGKARKSESELIKARDAARKNYADALNDKKTLGFRMIYGSAGTIGTYLSLKALGVIPTAAIGSVILMRSLATSTLSRTVRAALHAKIADLLDRTTGTNVGQPGAIGAAGATQVPPRGQGPTPPTNAPQVAANATTPPPTARPPQGGLSAMPPASAAASAPRQLTLLESATRAKAGSGDYVRGPSGAKSTAKSTAAERGVEHGAITPEQGKAETAARDARSSKDKAMLDRLDALYARKPKSGAENNAIKREVDEIKKVLSGEAKGSEASAINKRIADRERLAAKRTAAGAVQEGNKTGAGGEAIAQGASPEMRAIALDAGYKALSKYEGGESMAASLKATAKAMQKIDPSYDEVEKLTEALQVLKSIQ